MQERRELKDTIAYSPNIGEYPAIMEKHLQEFFSKLARFFPIMNALMQSIRSNEYIHFHAPRIVGIKSIQSIGKKASESYLTPFLCVEM